MHTSLNQWRSQGNFFDYRGHRIFWQDTQQGALPSLVLIHGFPTASWDWEKIWEPLRQHFRLITLDMIGFGFSDKPRSFDYSISEQANIFETLLTQLRIDTYHILAHDYGDTVAQEMMARHIEREPPGPIQSVCLLNGGLFPETHRPVLIQKLLLSPIGPLVARMTSFEKVSANLRKICTKPLSDEDLAGFWQLIQYNDGVSVMSKLIHYMTERQRYRERWVGALQRFDRPIRIIDGLDDPISGAHMVERFRELVPNPDVVGLDGVGHYPQVEAPTAVLNAYLEFAVKK